MSAQHCITLAIWGMLYIIFLVILSVSKKITFLLIRTLIDNNRKLIRLKLIHHVVILKHAIVIMCVHLTLYIYLTLSYL